MMTELDALWMRLIVPLSELERCRSRPFDFAFDLACELGSVSKRLMEIAREQNGGEKRLAEAFRCAHCRQKLRRKDPAPHSYFRDEGRDSFQCECGRTRVFGPPQTKATTGEKGEGASAERLFETRGPGGAGGSESVPTPASWWRPKVRGSFVPEQSGRGIPGQGVDGERGATIVSSPKSLRQRAVDLAKALRDHSLGVPREGVANVIDELLSELHVNERMSKSQASLMKEKDQQLSENLIELERLRGLQKRISQAGSVLRGLVAVIDA